MKQAADWMIQKRRGKCVCVHGTSVLTVKVADKRAGNIQVPVAYGWSPRPIFARYSYMKSHDWKQVC